MSVTISPDFKRALLRLHKKRQRNGLWCERACPFHSQLTAEKVWATHINGWTFLHHDNIDKMSKEGYFS